MDELSKEEFPDIRYFIYGTGPELNSIENIISETNNKKILAVRFPKHPVARKLLKILNTPLAAPSANISSKLSPTCASDVVDEFGSKIKFILDGGQCKIGLESTIIDLTNKPTILRQGIITTEKIADIAVSEIGFY